MQLHQMPVWYQREILLVLGICRVFSWCMLLENVDQLTDEPPNKIAYSHWLFTFSGMLFVNFLLATRIYCQPF